MLRCGELIIAAGFSPVFNSAKDTAPPHGPLFAGGALFGRTRSLVPGGTMQRVFIFIVIVGLAGFIATVVAILAR